MRIRIEGGREETVFHVSPDSAALMQASEGIGLFLSSIPDGEVPNYTIHVDMIVARDREKIVEWFTYLLGMLDHLNNPPAEKQEVDL